MIASARASNRFGTEMRSALAVPLSTANSNRADGFTGKAAAADALLRIQPA
jgi:hypothetical protein